uniref:Putative secreted protein n=1 Tax=Anopheles darlingi TaxID=43151 RepID=A0A2M4DPP4_ANODA
MKCNVYLIVIALTVWYGVWCLLEGESGGTLNRRPGQSPPEYLTNSEPPDSRWRTHIYNTFKQPDLVNQE